MTTQHLSLSGLSQLLLTQFWCSFLGTSRTDSNYQVGICPGNICSCDICPYPEYLSCYWLNFEQTLKEGSQKKYWLEFIRGRYVHLKFLYPKLFGLKIFLVPNFFYPILFCFWTKISLTEIFFFTKTTITITTTTTLMGFDTIEINLVSSGSMVNSSLAVWPKLAHCTRHFLAYFIEYCDECFS